MYLSVEISHDYHLHSLSHQFRITCYTVNGVSVFFVARTSQIQVYHAKRYWVLQYLARQSDMIQALLVLPAPCGCELPKHPPKLSSPLPYFMVEPLPTSNRMYLRFF